MGMNSKWMAANLVMAFGRMRIWWAKVAGNGREGEVCFENMEFLVDERHKEEEDFS